MFIHNPGKEQNIYVILYTKYEVRIGRVNIKQKTTLSSMNNQTIKNDKQDIIIAGDIFKKKKCTNT